MSRLCKVYQVAALGSAASLGWLCSQIYHVKTNDLKKKEWFGIPALPIYGTVSAATQQGMVMNVELSDNLIPEPAPKPNAQRIVQIMRFGFPSLNNIRSLSDFVLSYDSRNRIPHWVFEHLNEASVSKNEAVNRAICEFHEDTSIHHYFRSQNNDYKGSGFDRGHMAAAGNHKKYQKDCDETFLLSNMAPQVGRGFNRDKWNDLEMYCRKLTKNFRNVYICTGPLFLPRLEDDGKLYVIYRVIGKNHVAVPTHFFKVVVCEKDTGELELESFVMPNQSIDDAVPIETFHVEPDIIERASGLLFFDKIRRSKLCKINRKKLE